MPGPKNKNGPSTDSSADSEGPVGQGDYVVRKGECINSIAFDHGHFKDTLWNDSANADLKQTRKNPNILLEGDRLTIPPIRQKEDAGSTEKRHRFRRKGVPCKLRLCLFREDRPRANESYRLEIDGAILFSGKTDANGRIEHPLLPNARLGRLILGDGSEEYSIQLGHLDPVEELSGVQARLNNLGFYCGSVDGVYGSRTKNAIAQFQHAHGLDVDGLPGQETQAKLKEVYSC
jgi:hypothetical protein